MIPCVYMFNVAEMVNIGFLDDLKVILMTFYWFELRISLTISYNLCNIIDVIIFFHLPVPTHYLWDST